MKNYFKYFWLYITIAVATVIGLSSCGGDGDDEYEADPSKMIVGKWKLVNQGPLTVDYEEILEFRKKGTLKWSNIGNSGINVEYTYNLEDDWSCNEQYNSGRIRITSNNSQAIILNSYYSCGIASDNKSMRLAPWFDHDVYYIMDPACHFVRIK